MKIEIAKVIESLVEAMLPRFTINKILFISIRCNYDFYEERAHIELPAFTANFVFYRSSNYTKVLFQKLDKIFVHPSDLTTMQLKSDHDSCWRGDGVESVLSKIHFEQCDLLKSKIAKKARSKKFANSFHREIYKSYPSFATFERIKLIDGCINRKNYDERDFTLTYDKEKQFYTFQSKEKINESITI